MEIKLTKEFMNNIYDIQEQSMDDLFSYYGKVWDRVIEMIKENELEDSVKEQLGDDYEMILQYAPINMFQDPYYMEKLEMILPGIYKFYSDAIKESIDSDVLIQKKNILMETAKIIRECDITVETITELIQKYPILQNVFVHPRMIELTTSMGNYNFVGIDTFPISEKLRMEIKNNCNELGLKDCHRLSHELAKSVKGDVVTGYVTGDYPRSITRHSWVEKDDMVYDVNLGINMPKEEFYHCLEVEAFFKTPLEELESKDSVITCINPETDEAFEMPYISYKTLQLELKREKQLEKCFKRY